MSLPGFSGEVALYRSKSRYAMTTSRRLHEAVLVPSSIQCGPCAKQRDGSCVQTCYVNDPSTCHRGANGLIICTPAISGSYQHTCDPGACLGPTRQCCPYGCVQC